METLIKKQSASTLFDAMNECNVTGKHRTAVIVFSQDNFTQSYTEKERSYKSYSDQWGWNYSKLGNCRLGDCLDGKDNDIRLDAYNWKVEYWYWFD